MTPPSPEKARFDDAFAGLCWGAAVGLVLGICLTMLYVESYANALCQTRGYTSGEYNPFFPPAERIRCSRTEALP